MSLLVLYSLCCEKRCSTEAAQLCLYLSPHSPRLFPFVEYCYNICPLFFEIKRKSILFSLLHLEVLSYSNYSSVPLWIKSAVEKKTGMGWGDNHHLRQDSFYPIIITGLLFFIPTMIRAVFQNCRK